MSEKRACQNFGDLDVMGRETIFSVIFKTQAVL